jgi:hypothetical protein
MTAILRPVFVVALGLATAFATASPAHAGVQRNFGQPVSGAAASVTVTMTCPIGTKVVGAGGIVTGDVENPKVHTYISADGSQAFITAGVSNPLGVTWTLKPWVLCEDLRP